MCVLLSVCVCVSVCRAHTHTTGCIVNSTAEFIIYDSNIKPLLCNVSRALGSRRARVKKGVERPKRTTKSRRMSCTRACVVYDFCTTRQGVCVCACVTLDGCCSGVCVSAGLMYSSCLYPIQQTIFGIVPRAKKSVVIFFGRVLFDESAHRYIASLHRRIYAASRMGSLVNTGFISLRTLYPLFGGRAHVCGGRDAIRGELAYLYIHV